MSEYQPAHVHSEGTTFGAGRGARLREALQFIAMLVIAAAVLFSYEIYFFLAYDASFFEVLASAVQPAQQFYPPP